MDKEKKTATQKAITLPIKWNVPETMVTRFASNMVVQTIENEFKLSFFELKPKIHFNPSDTIPTEVIADCVASVIITVDRIPKFISALQKQLDTYNEKRQQVTEKS